MALTEWKSFKARWRDVPRIQDDLGVLQLALTAAGDKTSFVVFSAKTEDREMAELIFTPEAAALFDGYLQSHGATTCSPPPEDASTVVRVEWPS